MALVAWEILLQIKSDIEDFWKKLSSDISSSLTWVQWTIKESLSWLSWFAERNKEVFWSMAAAWWVALWALSAWIWKTISDASNLWESINAVNVVFWSASNIIKDFWEQSATSVWLSKRSFNQLATPIWAALQNVWLSADIAAKETINLTKRAADMASVFNVDVSDALWAIQAWLRWEADPLERFWVWLSETAVKAYAVKNWLIASWKEMTTQEKAVARLWLLYEQTARLEWDFANTSDQLANSKRILAAQVENISSTLWEAFLPVITSVLAKIRPVIDEFAEWVQDNPELTKNILLASWAIAWLVTVIWTLWLALPAIISWFTLLTWPIWIVAVAIAWLYLARQNNFLWIRDITDQVISFIKENIVPTILDIYNSIKDILLQFKQAWDDNLFWIQDIVRTFWESIQTYFWWLFDAIKLIVWVWFEIISWTIKTALEVISIVVKTAFDNIKLVISIVIDLLNWERWSAWEKAKQIFSNSANAMREIWTAVFNWLYDTIKWILDKVINYFWWVISRVRSFASEIASTISNVANFWWWRASWWLVNKWTTYLVWEKWPELFTPWSSWSIIPNNVLRWISLPSINIPSLWWSNWSSTTTISPTFNYTYPVNWQLLMRDLEYLMRWII